MQSGDTTDELMWTVVSIFILAIIIGFCFYWPVMKVRYNLSGDHRVHHVTLFTYFFSRSYDHDRNANAGLDCIYNIKQLYFK